MKISILLPYYNDSAYIAESIKSILDQSFTDFELILINHASTDHSEEIARSFNDSRIKHVLMRQNAGAGGGLIMLEFLKVATGDYFKSMCADDVMKPNCLRNLNAFLDKNPEFAAVFGNMDFIDSDSKDLGGNWWNEKKLESLDIDYLAKFFNGTSLLPYPAAMVRMDTLRQSNQNIILHAMYDMSLWSQLLLKHQIKCLNASVIDYRIHEAQASSSSKLDKLIRISAFETVFFCDLFCQMTMRQCKQLLRDDLFVNLTNDERFVPFIIAHHFSVSKNKSHNMFGLSKLHEILHNDKMRADIFETFGYSVKDLRARYAEIDLFYSEDLRKIKTKKLVRELKRRFKSIFKKKQKLRVV